MIHSTKLYPYGFLFSDVETSNVPQYYSKTKILNKYYYYFDHVLDIHTIEKGDRFILIHGDFLHIGIDDMLPKFELLNLMFEQYNNYYEEFLDTMDFIAGRFTVIVGNSDRVEIYPDATNSRSAFFLKNRTVVSSHAHLLNDCFDLTKADINGGFKNVLLNTPYNEVGSAIPNHSLTLGTNEFKRFFPRKKNKYTHLSENKQFSLIERFWKEQLNSVLTKEDNVFLSLTGGGDSRTSLALTREYLDQLELITYAVTDGNDKTNHTTRVLSNDNFIVKQMVNDLNLSHKFFYFDADDKELTEEENFAISKNSIARHSGFFVAYLRNNFDLENLIHIRANLLEIGQAYLIKDEYDDNNVESGLKTFFKRFNAVIGKKDTVKEVAKNMYYDYIEETKFGENIYDYHLIDLLYWEVFMGRWYPELLNTHDIACDTVSPYNHRALIDITLAMPYEKRKSRYFQYELINRNFPVLNFYGLNNRNNLYEQMKLNK